VALNPGRGRVQRIALVAGARPNFMKAAPVLAALRTYPRFAVELVHTGQHYDRQMSDAFFTDLGLPDPDVQLGVGSGSHAEQTARVMVAFEAYMTERRPDLVIVIGDVNSTLGCSVVAAKAGTPLAHVEAGLRSFDRTMPEEINRIVTDALSGILFTTSSDADEHLLAEGHPREEIHLVGNTMIDTLERFRHQASNLSVPRSVGVEPGAYLLVTLHRPANVDDPAALREILGALVELPLPVVLPMHPRTRSAAYAAGADHLLDRLRVVPPQGYLDFLALQAQAAAVLTDSGGIQEETTVLGVPCLTFRENTERPITISQGTNRLIGTRPEAIGPAVRAVLGEDRPPARVPPLWDGHAGERIAGVLDRLL
jgi:UDP-N-acetylglucosamine 2-epimerase (non-hydrolysing)